MNDESMPADPFRDGLIDWNPQAGMNFAFFTAHLAAGFTEGQALDLTGRYLSFVISVIFANQAQQQQQEPGEPA